MLDKTIAVSNLKLIIHKVRGCMVNREIFENALYDCFDSVFDIENLMSGYDYFALLIKKPKIDIAVASIMKNSSLSREYAKMICDIWFDAKFSGFTEQDIAATIAIVDDDLVVTIFEEDSIRFDGQQSIRLNSERRSIQKKSYERRSLQKISIDREEKVQKRQKDKIIKKINEAESVREVPARKWYKKITGRDTVVDDRYSTVEKIMLILAFAVGYFVPVLLSYFIADKSVFWVRSVVVLFTYIVFGFVYYMYFARNKLVNVPLRWTALCTLAIGFIMLAIYQLYDMIEIMYVPQVQNLKYIAFAFFVLASVSTFYLMGRNVPNLQRMLFSTLFGMVLLPLLLFFYIYMSNINLMFTSDNGSQAMLFLTCAFMILYFPFCIVESLIFRNRGVVSTFITNISFGFLLTFMQFISYVSMMYYISVEWYYSFSLAILTLVSVYCIFYKRFTFKYLYCRLLYIGIFTVSMFVIGGVFALVALMLKASLYRVLISSTVAFLFVGLIMFALRIFLGKVMSVSPSKRTYKK